MKTKNNVQKTVLRSAAVVASFVLISLTVTAQEFWKAVLTNSSFNQIALAMVETSKKTNAPASATGNSSNSTFYVTDYDSKLEIENWMTDNNSYRADFIQQVAKDENLQVENWMLGDQIFVVATETEDPLTLENWMIISKTWEN
jgi:hypothetical protein